MKRLAWFTPLPPTRSGIAGYSIELLSRIGNRYRVDVFVETTRHDAPPGVGAVFNAHDFVWKHAVESYDLVVYQLGNSPCHDYMWPYLSRFPGLVTLHDGHLHHSRARWLLQEGRPDDYRAEFLFNHPDANTIVVELGIAGLLESLTYLWPMRRVVLASSRLVLVHNTRLKQELQLEMSDVPVVVVEMGVPDRPLLPTARERLRTHLQITPDTVVFAAFGKVTPEKRISRALHALATLDSAAPWHLMLCGETVDYYDPRAEAQRLGIGDRVTVTGYIDEEVLPDYVASSDVGFCLRWPSSRETSASWLRCLAAGKPTIVTDLVHLTDVPSIDPRDWNVAGCPTGRDSYGNLVHPACVSIDILDEDHSLALAVSRIVTDRGFRATLGRNARNLWEDRFTLDRMASGYAHAIDEACTRTADDLRRRTLPPHLRRDGTERARSLLAELGLPATRLAEFSPESSQRSTQGNSQ